jgi:hypothetical protein
MFKPIATISPAENSAAILQQAARGGAPLLIPGALELRASRPPARPANAPADPAPSRPGGAVADDRGRLEHEREGGGAPSERTGRHASWWPVTPRG